MTVRQTLLDLHNARRRALGLHTLVLNSTLNQGADRYADIMASQSWFSHDRPSGLTWLQWWDGYYPERLDYPGEGIGENIARGQSSTSEVFQAWMDSPLHRANIEKASFRSVGFGQNTASDGRIYWVAHFCTANTSS